MQTLAAEVWTALSSRAPNATLIKHGGPNRYLAFFIVSAWARTLTLALRRRVDVVVCSDAATLIVMWPLLALFRVPRIAIVNGLDLTWTAPVYRRLVRATLPRAARVLAISTSTAAVARELGVDGDRLSVVRLAVGAPLVSSEDRKSARLAIRGSLALDDDAIILLTLGRLVERKGARWFVSEVMPNLPDEVHYVIAGSGAEQEAIEQAVAATGLEHRVHLTGQVSDAERETLLRGADLFVQPNLPVPGDMEGFGLVLVEAAKRGTPVVASALEGIQDAVLDGETGTLCPPGDAAAWTATVSRLSADTALIERLGRHGQVRATELFNPAALADQLELELLTATRCTDGS